MHDLKKYGCAHNKIKEITKTTFANDYCFKKLKILISSFQMSFRFLQGLGNFRNKCKDINAILTPKLILLGFVYVIANSNTLN